MKKFSLNLDAAIVLSVLGLASLGGNAYQHLQYKDLQDENFRLQLQGLEDRMNLDSQQHYIKRLNTKLERLNEQASDTVSAKAAETPDPGQ